MGTVHFIEQETLAGTGGDGIRDYKIRVARKIRRPDGTMANAAVRQAVSEYQANGWTIIACRGDKTPIGQRWNTIPRSHQQLLQDLDKDDAVGIGFPGGALNRNVVPLDFDSPAGFDWWLAKLKEAGMNPDKFPTAMTPGKHLADGTRWPGRHVYLWDHRGTLGNSAGQLAELGIDVRGDGFVVLAPSPHPEGGEYRWIRPLGNIDSVPEVPAFVYDAIAARPEKKSTPEPEKPRANGADAPSDRARKHAWDMLRFHRQELGATPPSARHGRLNDAAYALGRLADTGAFTQDEARAALMAACAANGMLGEGRRAEVERTITEAWTAGLGNSRDVDGEWQEHREANGAGHSQAPRPNGADPDAGPEHAEGDYFGPEGDTSAPHNEQTKASSTAKLKPKPSVGPLQTFTAIELVQRQYAPLDWCVEEILPTGLCILAGRPKIGKSWLAFCLAIDIACGGYTLGKFKTRRGEVLYLPLEDPGRRLQSRMNMLLGEIAVPEGLHFRESWPRLDKGGLEALAEWLDAHPACRVVIVDTFGKIRSESIDRRQNAYQSEYGEVGDLQAFANQRGIALILVHHTRKADASDVYDTINGTTGITGAADTLLVLTRKRDEAIGVLSITGRDIVDDGDFACQFDKTTGRWSISGKAEEVRAETQQGAIFRFLHQQIDPCGPRDIAEETGISYKVVQNILRKLMKKGLARKAARGLWEIDGGRKDGGQPEA